MPKFCYWSVADGDEHSKMIQTCIASARNAGVEEDFHVWSDREIPGATQTHPTGDFDHDLYLFKYHFLRDEVQKLDYDFFVFLDADNFFVRKPDENFLERLMRNNRWFVQMESWMNGPTVTRGEWWGCPTQWWPVLVKAFCAESGMEHSLKGVQEQRFYNTNAGMFIVKRENVNLFCDLAIRFHTYAREHLKLINFTEEPALAFLGHLVDDPNLNCHGRTKWFWASDWTAWFNDRLPDGKPWQAEDYMSGQKLNNTNPAIVHAMRAKNALVMAADQPSLFPKQLRAKVPLKFAPKTEVTTP